MSKNETFRDSSEQLDETQTDTIAANGLRKRINSVGQKIGVKGAATIAAGALLVGAPTAMLIDDLRHGYPAQDSISQDVNTPNVEVAKVPQEIIETTEAALEYIEFRKEYIWIGGDDNHDVIGGINMDDPSVFKTGGEVADYVEVSDNTNLKVALANLQKAMKTAEQAADEYAKQIVANEISEVDDLGPANEAVVGALRIFSKQLHEQNVS